MLETLLARLGFEAGFKVSKTLIIVALAVLAGFLFWRGLARIDAMQARTERLAIAARDAHWTSEIAKSNEAVALQRIQDEHLAQQRTAVAEQKITDLQASLADMEKKNAALPNGDRCGLGRDHGRLLNP